ncbi:MAG: hypothetical protein HC767_07715 [Akkermansiaceae bacterium]|nr:hypothetical protein [Akkermansiaceae bacterium]
MNSPQRVRSPSSNGDFLIAAQRSLPNALVSATARDVGKHPPAAMWVSQSYNFPRFSPELSRSCGWGFLFLLQRCQQSRHASAETEKEVFPREICKRGLPRVAEIPSEHFFDFSNEFLVW